MVPARERWRNCLAKDMDSGDRPREVVLEEFSSER